MAMLTRYDPFRDALSLRDAMDRLFQESFVVPSAVGSGRVGWVAMDVDETPDHYTMKVSLPGWKPEDVNITIQDATVTISGQIQSKESQTADEKRTWHLRERAFASFNRTFTFPMAVSAEKAQAEFENGELILTLPKAESAKPRQITIGRKAA
jgi:HSP20 family protein